MALTKRAIDGFKYEGGWDVRWDGKVPGFGVRLYPNGRKAFVLSYRFHGRKRLMVIGAFGADYTLDEARARATKLRVLVREGTDPLEDKQCANIEAAAERPLNDLIIDYIEKHAKVHKKTWRNDERRLNRNITAKLKRVKARNVTHADIEALLSTIGSTRPYEANRLLEILRVMFRRGRSWGYLKSDDEDPTNDIKCPSGDFMCRMNRLSGAPS